MINPGTQPVDGASEEAATANLTAFLAAVRDRATQLNDVPIRHRTAALTGETIRDPSADREGRYGFVLPFTDGSTVRLLMPGVDLDRLHDLAATAPCLFVNDDAWWWNGAVDMVAGEGMHMRPT